MDKIASHENSITQIPTLPANVHIPENIGVNACPWLDNYIAFSRKWSPISYYGYHEAVGIFLLSTVAARRVAYNFGKVGYTNLYIAMVGRTSIHAKTSTAEIGIDTLRMAGLDWLLAPDSSTPQWLIKSMASTSLPKDYEHFPDDRQERALLKALTSGQRGWYFDEFGMLVSAMMRREGVMNDFRGLLRKFDDAPLSYETATIIRGNEVVERPYLALLANLTPADLKPFANRGAALWGDGYLARFALVTPPSGHLEFGRFPRGQRVIPTNLITPIHNWHERLGLPQYTINDEAGVPILSFQPNPPLYVELSEESYEAYYQYFEALREIVSLSNDTDLDGNYSRFPEKALRISALFASLSDCPRIELSHWARAQSITERWRAGLHELYQQVGASEAVQPPSNEDKILRIIHLKGHPTKRELVQFTKLPYDDVKEGLNALLLCNKITVKPNGRKDVYEIL